MTDIENKPKRLLLGICGKKGSGKDTVARLLNEQFGVQRLAFADKLKDVCMDVFGLTRKQVHGSLQDKETIDPRWGISPRTILQNIGTEGFRAVHKEVWVRYALGQIESDPYPLWAIPDVRFVDEAEAVRKAGGVVWKIIRPGLAPGIGHAHSSETEIDKIDGDFEIINTGTIENLTQIVMTHFAVLGHAATIPPLESGQCPSTCFDRFSGMPNRCRLSPGHEGYHDDGCMTWSDDA